MTAPSVTRKLEGSAYWIMLGAGGLAMTVAGLVTAGGIPVEAWFFVFVIVAGLVVGSLGLLMIGHLMSEEWLAPVRAEAEAAALTAPFLVMLAVPLAPALSEIYPWSAGVPLDMPPARAAYLTAPFFLGRGALYLAVWVALALWIARTLQLRRASAIGLALLAPTATFAANDWVLSREPLWWSSLFGFAFAISQLLAALAGAILVSLLRPEHPTPVRMRSLERALLTLALMTFWVWFVHFLIVWLGNLPNEAAWYLARSGDRLWLLLGVALPALVAAVFILAPPGFGRWIMITGSALLLVQHGAHMLWISRPAGNPWGAIVATGLLLIWAALFASILRKRPTFESERGISPDARARRY